MSERDAYYDQLNWLRRASEDIKKFTDLELQYVSHTLTSWSNEYEAPKAYRCKAVYFVQAKTGGPIKIGTAGLYCVAKRLDSLQIGNPEELVIRATVVGGRTLERAFHIEFSHLRIRGEWFRNEPELARIAKAMSSDGVDYMWSAEARSQNSSFSGGVPIDRPRLKSRGPRRVLSSQGADDDAA